MTTAPGIKAYQAYCVQVQLQQQVSPVPLCFSTMVSDDKDDFNGEVDLDDQSFTSNPVISSFLHPQPAPQDTLQTEEVKPSSPRQVEFQQEAPTAHVIPPEEEPTTMSSKDQLLCWQY
ncbi:hypothetical protein ACA910_003508 [Epithemia clementina (nom. ined.)]